MKRTFFGTDGIRGIANVNPMTPEIALRLGKAVTEVLRNGNRPRILIGKDTRISGYMLESALTAGICSMGGDVLLVGPIPTPAIAHLVKSFACDAGIVISASHNPWDHNGIKIFSKEGFKLADEVEAKIEQLMMSNTVNNEHVRGDLIGRAKRIDDAKGRYIEFAKASINNFSLKGLKIVLDVANGAAYDITPHILQELGAEVTVLCNKPDGTNINLDCGSMHPELIRKTVIEQKADIGIALDGDADRVIMVDELGNEIDGDHLMAIIGIDMKEKKELANNTIVGTVMTNKGFDIFMEKNGITVVRTQVGDPYVVEEMLKSGYNFGGEQSGHIILMDHTTTPDATITALRILRILREKKDKASSLTAIFKSLPQVLENSQVREKRELESMPKVMKIIKEKEQILGKAGRVLVRYSGTENKVRVMVEGADEKAIKQHAQEIMQAILNEVGI